MTSMKTFCSSRMRSAFELSGAEGIEMAEPDAVAGGPEEEANRFCAKQVARFCASMRLPASA